MRRVVITGGAGFVGSPLSVVLEKEGYDVVHLSRQKHLPVFLPHVPAWLLHLVLGEMSVVLTSGSRISVDRLIGTGFEFRYPDIDLALKAITPALKSPPVYSYR
jgi:NAD dependent epimerase/dehydratase family enzyme